MSSFACRRSAVSTDYEGCFRPTPKLSISTNFSLFALLSIHSAAEIDHEQESWLDFIGFQALFSLDISILVLHFTDHPLSFFRVTFMISSFSRSSAYPDSLSHSSKPA
jgi:hypothetical protein